jgi:hypothetical protein
MDKQQAGQWVVPNPQIPRSFGVMNLAFGGIFLLVGLGSAAWTYISPAFTQQIQVSVQQELADAKAKRQGEIAALKEKLKAAKAEEEKKDLETQLDALESNDGPDPTMFNDMMGLASDIRLVIYTWTELIVGILLNLLMIIAGVGLLALAEWARRMAITVAWLKIAKWAAVVVVTLVLVIPVTTEKMQKMFTKIQAQTATKGGRTTVAFPMGSLAQFTAVMSAVSSVGMALVASVYPAASIWFLTRPRARAACLAAQASAGPLPDGELAGP